MLITVLEQKYKVGCERGTAEEVAPNILIHLNTIIEWDKCEFPKDKDGNENRKFLGDTPELKPGDCFFYEGNVIACDREDRLILIISETGPGALHRIRTEIIEPEFNLLFNYIDVMDIEYKEVPISEVETLPEDVYKTYPVTFYLMKLFREKVAFGRFFKEPQNKTAIKCNVDFYVPITMYITDWKMVFNTSEIDEDMIDVVEREILAWFYRKFDRILPPKPEVPDISKYID